MMSMVGGKTLTFNEDPIGLDTEVKYIDQNGKSCLVDMHKFLELAKESKDEYFEGWLHWLENKELTIGSFIITGLDMLAREFPDKIDMVIKELDKNGD